MFIEIGIQRQLQTANDKQTITPSYAGLSKVSRVIRFNHVLSGNVRSDFQEGFYFLNSKFDVSWNADIGINWNEENNYNIKALHELIENAQNAVAANKDCQKLLKKDPAKWSKADRQIWQERISWIVSNCADSIAPFSEYRDMDSGIKVRNINDLTKKDNYVCRDIAFVEGIAIQSVENHFLKESAKNYFYFTGIRNVINNGLLGEHAYIMAENGDIIEATKNKGRCPYSINIDKDFNIKRHLAGFPALVESYGELNYYGELGFDGSNEILAICKKRYDAIKDENITDLDKHGLAVLEDNRVGLLDLLQYKKDSIKGKNYVLQAYSSKFTEDQQIDVALDIIKYYLEDGILLDTEKKAICNLDDVLDKVSFTIKENDVQVSYHRSNFDVYKVIKDSRNR